MDLRSLEDELRWLKENPHFIERPASLEEFLGEGYLNIADRVRPGLKVALKAIFGEDVNPKRLSMVERAMMTGGIGIGKTTFASIAIPYMVHWVMCLKDPQAYYGLMPGARIAFMQMSTSEDQARDVIFGDIKARIQHSKWFVENAMYDTKYSKVLKFPKEIWVIPGDSAETTFEGYNILGGILDEMDSHKVTVNKDFAEQGFDTIHSRIGSRFVELDSEGNEGHKGLLIVIGQMKKSTGFAFKKYQELLKDPKAYVMRMSIWESFGWERFTKKDGTRNSFWYDSRRKEIIPTDLAKLVKNEYMIEIPVPYKQNFITNPIKALRDLAGIPPEAEDPFISLADRVDDCRTKWIDRHGPESPVGTALKRPKFAEWFRAENDPRRRCIHVDLAYSAEGDALGMAMGHIDHLIEIDGELKPYIVFDMLLRMKASAGTEILLSEVRQIIYHLKEDRGFKITKVSYDGFESTDTIQQLRKKRYEAEKISVDKSTLPYEDLREAIYERRVEFPPYMTPLGYESTDLVDIATHELLALQDTGKKVDHPPSGSKDVADAMAGVCYLLMGDRNFRRGVTKLRPRRDRELADTGTEGKNWLEDYTAPPEDLTSPVPPMMAGEDLGIMIPTRLRPRNR